MNRYPPSFSQVYSVSDLHMGGRVDGGHDFQIFAKGARLARWLQELARQPQAGDVALVLNGDVIDALAEDPHGYVASSESAARSLIERIIADPAFAPVFEGLATFLRSPGRHIVVVAGNHDIELALPVVQHVLRERLTAGTTPADGAAARLTFATSGEGFACSVGGARVFFTHGNEYDVANAVDHEKLAQLGRAQNQGRSVDAEAWVPNMGTRLVIDVMNRIKAHYPFVDLLKPTNAALEAVLISLGAKSLRELRHLPGLVASGLRTSLTRGALLEGEEPDDVGDPGLPAFRSRRRVEDEDGLLLAADRGELESTLVDPVDGTLGVRDVLWSWIPGVGSERQLREALADWASDGRPEDDIERPDAQYDRIAAERPPATFTVTGHTHRARSIAMGNGRYYFNSGTWIRLLQVTRDSLAKDQFGVLWKALNAGTTAELDGTSIAGRDAQGQPTEVGLVLDFTTAVRIGVRDGSVVGELLQIEDGPDGTTRERRLGDERTAPASTVAVAVAP